MTKQVVKGKVWDIKSIDGNTVTLADGQQIEVSDETLAEIQANSKPKKSTFKLK